MNKGITDFPEYHKTYSASITNPEKFWETIAETHFWRSRWDKTLAEAKHAEILSMLESR